MVQVYSLIYNERAYSKSQYLEILEIETVQISNINMFLISSQYNIISFANITKPAMIRFRFDSHFNHKKAIKI